MVNTISQIDTLLAEYQELDRLAVLRQGPGLWQDRKDLPDFAELRGEWNRFLEEANQLARDEPIS